MDDFLADLGGDHGRGHVLTRPDVTDGYVWGLVRLTRSDRKSPRSGR